ncbi:hypothetical protein [Streptomyces luteolifulvus]|jgi:hypothetical protein|nr:hypothetical protein [Streptomyces luteolifulvus]
MRITVRVEPRHAGGGLLQQHPDLPLTGFAISSSICPEPGRPRTA